MARRAKNGRTHQRDSGKRVLTVNLEPEDYAALQEAARMCGRPMTACVRAALRHLVRVAKANGCIYVSDLDRMYRLHAPIGLVAPKGSKG